MPVLILKYLTLLTLSQPLVLLLEVLHDLSVVNLLLAALVDLLLRNLFDLEHYLVESVLIDQPVP